jgi:hypothetical protein
MRIMGKKKSGKNGKPEKDQKPKFTVKELKIRRHMPVDQPSVFANNLVIQHEKSTFQLLFFEVRPPVILEEGEEARRLLEQLDHTDAQCVARIILPADIMPAIINAIQDNFQKHQAKAAGIAEIVKIDGKTDSASQ